MTKDPILPGDREDRTGTRGILRRAVADINRRWTGLRRDVLGVWDGVKVLTANAETDTVVYTVTPDEMAATNHALRDALERWIEAGREAKNIFWYDVYDQEASQAGATQSLNNLTRLSPAYGAQRNLQQILFSQPYRTRVSLAQIKSYDHWMGLQAGLRSELSQIIGRAIVDGRNPRAVRTEIADKLEVSRGRAAGYAQTDITDTLRQARLAEDQWAEDELGVRTGELWTSALIPTTRPWHASRNGKVYTREQVQKFYQEAGNRYRCFLPDMLIAGRIQAGVKSLYKGPAVRFVTAGGRELSVTSNHPVLTARGMVPAAELREGDDLVTYGGQVERGFGVVDLNGRLVGTRAEDLFRALVDVGHQLTTRVSPVDLHGDAAFAQPQVQVVLPERELVFDLNASGAKLLDDIQFVLADDPAFAHRALEAFFHQLRTYPGGVVCGRGVGEAFCRRELTHAVALGVAHVAQGHSGSDKATRDDGAANSGLQPEPVDGRSGVVSVDQVAQVFTFEYHGHVFDFQEKSGLLIGNNIVVSNCHCSVTACLLDSDGRPILTKKLQSTMSNELSAWKKVYGG